MGSGIFDMIGPVMIGPSSSHTAGVVRIGLFAHHYLGGVPDEVKVTFYNSFATTYKGHGSDRAVVGGLMGMPTDDFGIKNALDLAEERGIQIEYTKIGNASDLHPNTIRIEARMGEKHIEVLGESKGGGVIRIAQIDGFASNIDGSLQTLILTAEDRPGAIAFITELISHDRCNIASMTVSRQSKQGTAMHVIELDSPLRPLTKQFIESIEWVRSVSALSPLS